MLPATRNSAHGAPASHCFDAAAGVTSNASTEWSAGCLAADAGSPRVTVCFTPDDGKRIMTTASASILFPIEPSGGRPLSYACTAPTFPSISCGSSSSKITTENQWFGRSGGGSRPQPPPHQSQASRSNSSTSAYSTIHGGPGGEAYKTADEAASAAASEVEACGDNAGNAQCGDPWDTDPSAVDLLLLLRGAPSTNEMAGQPAYETTLGPRVKQRETDQGPDRPAQSPAITLLGPQQQPRTGPLHPVPPSPPGVSATPGHKGGTTRQPPPQDARRPKPLPHQGSSRSAPVSSRTQQQPVPTPHGSSSSGSGNPSTPTPATRDHDPVFRQASAATDQSHPPPWSPTSGNAPAGVVAVKRSIHAGVKALPPGSARRPRHSSHRNEAPPQNGSDHALQPPRAPPPADSLPSYPCDIPRKSEEKRGRPAAPPTKINGAPSKGISPTPPKTDNAQRQDNQRQDRPERNSQCRPPEELVARWTTRNELRHLD
ncbi:basic salivary proline-rich protein 4-like [Dermacentor silvarum]|uniref:basic salivary proline-rich protein 4-like n=1 Tax=Dermacentor silvarum TaxID=543639 RepID=UPI00189B7B41|nr:basic salivary proline-rich protein 4-like [Dermacentor silvarum]